LNWFYYNEAFLFDGNTLRGLGDLGGGSSEAVAINERGTVIGNSDIPGRAFHGFIYKNGAMSDLGTLGGRGSSAWAVNNLDLVVGDSATATGEIHAFLYVNGNMTDLGTLGGTYSSATGINDAGQVIGDSTTRLNATHGFIYQGGSLTDLGTLGGPGSSVKAINNLGQVVGSASTGGGASHAFLWQNNAMLDLNTVLPTDSGWELESADFITDAGLIVGEGTYMGTGCWFMLTLGSSANRPPFAVAGPDQTGECPAVFVLDGSSSHDLDGDELSYEWTILETVVGTEPQLSMPFPMGVTVVNLKVSDPCGAFSEANARVTIDDRTPPGGDCPPGTQAAAGPLCEAAVPDFTALIHATDNCTPADALAVSQDPAAGALVGLGAHPVTLTVTDAAGNSSVCHTLFTVEDLTPPAFLNVTVSPTELQPPNHQLIPVVVKIVATDSCDSVPACKIVSITSNEALEPGEAQITGELTALLAATRSPSGDGRTYTITLQSADAAGNRAQASVEVRVPKGNGNGTGGINPHMRGRRI
jgi:probable HAF family extracellular repeat protein